jgi:hypothetical protein
MLLNPEKARECFFKEVNNCYWNPKLSITTLPNGDRTVITNDNIYENEPLVVLNPNSFFNTEQCFIYSKEDLSLLPKRLVIPAYLYQFYTKHTEKYPSGYDHYFNALPTYQWYLKNHELLKVYTKMSSKQKESLKENLFLISDFDEIQEWAKKIPNHTFNHEEAIRSILAVATRSWANAGLVPWIDFFNHYSEGSYLKNDGTTITASHFYNKNEEVNTSYGLKDSLQLLTIYGYKTQEKTIGICRPKLSPFSIALNKDLEKYEDFSQDNPFLFGLNLDQFSYFLSHMRLSAVSKYDTLFISNLQDECTSFINGANELKALEIGLVCTHTTRENLEKIKAKFASISNIIPQSFVEDFEVKFKILDNLEEKINEHWNTILKNKNFEIQKSLNKETFSS